MASSKAGFGADSFENPAPEPLKIERLHQPCGSIHSITNN